MKLIVIADDFTGALDTGVQFVNGGATAEVVTRTDLDFFRDTEAEVVVVDTESRHLSPEKAYKIVYDLTKSALAQGVSGIYKKTDSGLRGNIGPEIRAVLEASGQSFLPFIPAYPAMNRIVRGGVSYIDGVPANESVFGKDPFEPVTISRVRDLFQKDEKTKEVALGKTVRLSCLKEPTVGIYDGETAQDMMQIAAGLYKIQPKDQPRIAAGCAGFAGAFGSLFRFSFADFRDQPLKKPALVICGSINDVSKAQILKAREENLPVQPLTHTTLFASDGLTSAEGEATRQKILAAIDATGACIVDTVYTEGLGNPKDLEGISTDEARVQIAARLGELTAGLMEKKPGLLLTVIGGDTLAAVLEALKAGSIRIRRELSDGVVLFEVKTPAGPIQVVSKSGGFGQPEWLADLLLREMEEEKMRPIIGITMGDPAGNGPELCVKALMEESVYENAKPLIVGDACCLQDIMSHMRGTEVFRVHPVMEVSEALFTYGVIDVLDMGLVDLEKRIYMKDRAELKATLGEEAAAKKIEESAKMCGNAAFQYVKKVIELAMAKQVDGTVTNALNKERINQAGHHYDGHTEIYATFTGTKKYAMMLAHEDFRVIHVSTHVSLREACDRVKKARVLEIIRLADAECKRIGIPNPKIGVAGLNPHCGEGGLFGREEIEEIQPAIDEALSEGINIPDKRPTPPDTIFSKMAGGFYDICVCMYHDQGHIPTKLKGFVYNRELQKWDAVSGINVTLGLPIVRVSVDHGTGEDVAGTYVSDPASLLNSIDYATKACN